VEEIVNSATGRTVVKNSYEEKEFLKLRGKYKHYCPDWDGMAIDETSSEFAECLCYSERENNP
jgi:hypothetical protein